MSKFGWRSDKINNPILPGFNPDPSICRVGNDYYIATSTFEWYPGVQIHHSTDLQHWQLITRVLNRPDLLSMLGTPDSCGVWAPCLSYHKGKFYLLYTDVKRFAGNFKDTHNYLTTCTTIDGDWSKPVHINSSGFDPSLFHDDDGKQWVLNMIWDHRPDRSPFQGIVIQEYSEQKQALIGVRHIIFDGSELGCTEGPHIYKKAGFYYLLTAEGGTGYQHGETTARSKHILGPYEIDPIGQFITAKDSPLSPLQRTGHGDIVETANGDLYFVHLCSRPITSQRRSPMGRETALQKLIFTQDKWFRLENGGDKAPFNVGQQYLPLPATKNNHGVGNYNGDNSAIADFNSNSANINNIQINNSHFDDFENPELSIEFQWLRTPYPQEFMSLTKRPGYLRLKGMESVGSLFKQALIARRQQAFRYQATTKVEFSPSTFQQQAGLINYYNGSKYHYLYISYDEVVGKYIGIMNCEGDSSLAAKFPLGVTGVAIAVDVAVYLRANVDYQALNFSYSLDGHTFIDLGITLDASVICDETGEGANFTGAFIGLCCQDLTGLSNSADFDFFDYQEFY